MQVEYTRAYKSSAKKLKKKNKDLLSKIEESENILRDNHEDNRLHFKHMQCKKNKTMHSIRVINTQYRILFTLYENIAELRCVCDHDEYDRRNKNC